MELLARSKIEKLLPPESELKILANNTIYAHYGPMRLTVKCIDDKGPNLKVAVNSAFYGFSLLQEMAVIKNLFKLENFKKIKIERIKQPLLKNMLLSTAQLQEENLTPMAAVAGAVADEIIKYAVNFKQNKIIVENGGDLAIYLNEKETAVVGIKKKLTDIQPSLKITLSGSKQNYWGVATSGLGGRGLTQGVLDSVVCVTSSGALADAAATAVNNKSKISSANIKYTLAENIFPNTDIKGLEVIKERNNLTKKEEAKALEQALIYAENLVNKNIIMGSILSLNNKFKNTKKFTEKVSIIKEL